MKFYLASALVFLEAALVSGSGCSSLEHFWGVQHDILSEAECCGLIDPNFGFNLESLASILPAGLYAECEPEFVGAMLGTEEESADLAFGLRGPTMALGRMTFDLCGLLGETAPPANGRRETADRMAGGACWDACNRADLAEAAFLQCAMEGIGQELSLCPASV